ncbi:MAG: glycerol-3-phosphate 1-O-acyltransferase PlsY [Dehalococcoidia bacterium]
MNNIFEIFVICSIAYLIGSIPTGVIVAKFVKGVDIRSYGSGSSGATNVARTLGPKLGAIVLISDILKGYISIFIISNFANDYWIIPFSGFLLVLGHCYPIYIKFRGGKGITTGFGTLLFLSPIAMALSLIGVSIAIITRYISLGSIIGTLLSLVSLLIFSIYEIFGSKQHDLLYCIPVGLIILLRHRSNFFRLIKGNEGKLENKASPKKKQN